MLNSKGHKMTPAMPPKRPTEAIPMLSSKDLFGGEKEIRIVHRDQIYCLRITRENKLILTK
ncbi:hemin uptake protein HemP [Denitratisoma sp. DHT3]|uniref:hemin uptake protein HemP n=1 Tax=Denitratisoma sp. DHT3 TaxID=1981880 RepID=UPI0021BD87DF|nr:hemin uptake protein HemP [Denitratisoma sp. DHT3]